ncbi:uncharacterized protein EDB93DRAFT_1255311 [Suillus bovinus]|uniref:uncharacterized protein n=1 Tax=Suillus bovinus TaxID=48563 RepID=UPI001B86363B|nr:uncharacterized protein EDB93DRAFT_1255311 [Suillus bovinus]KAG2132126.1 hypothetical protein EDB93DRAFT_1255311 [Suillus bovinus]
MSMSASRIRACIFQYQAQAANNNLPPLAWIRHFKAGLQWDITTFVTPILQYSAARKIISVIPSPIAHILHLIAGHTWNMDGIENDSLTLPEQVDHTSVPSLIGLRWIRERLLTLLEEQHEGIHDKMAEIQIYTAILDRLKRGRGE